MPQAAIKHGFAFIPFQRKLISYCSSRTCGTLHIMSKHSPRCHECNREVQREDTRSFLAELVAVGSELGMYCLAHHYFDDDRKNGMKLMHESAALGFTAAESEFGVGLLMGDFSLPFAMNSRQCGARIAKTKECVRVGVMFVVRAAAKDDAIAMYNLSRCYLAGIGVEVDHEHAFKLTIQSALLGNQRAIEDLGQLNSNDSISKLLESPTLGHDLNAGLDSSGVSVEKQPCDAAAVDMEYGICGKCGTSIGIIDFLHCSCGHDFEVKNLISNFDL